MQSVHKNMCLRWLPSHLFLHSCCLYLPYCLCKITGHLSITMYVNYSLYLLSCYLQQCIDHSWITDLWSTQQMPAVCASCLAFSVPSGTQHNPWPPPYDTEDSPTRKLSHNASTGSAWLAFTLLWRSRSDTEHLLLPAEPHEPPNTVIARTTVPIYPCIHPFSLTHQNNQILFSCH